MRLGIAVVSGRMFGLLLCVYLMLQGIGFESRLMLRLLLLQLAMVRPAVGFELLPRRNAALAVGLYKHVYYSRCDYNTRCEPTTQCVEHAKGGTQCVEHAMWNTMCRACNVAHIPCRYMHCQFVMCCV